MAPFNQRQIGYIQAIAGRQQHVTLICGQDDGQISSANNPGTNQKCQALDDLRVKTQYTTGNALDAKSLLLHNWLLDRSELCYDSRDRHNDGRLEQEDFSSLAETRYGLGDSTELRVFEAPVQGTYGLSSTHTGTEADRSGIAGGELVMNEDHIKSTARATPDGYLNSTNVKFRFTLPDRITNASDSNHPMGQDHYEFRWIVWRNRLPTMQKQADDDGAHSNLEAIRDGASFRNPAYDFFMGQTGRKRGLVGYCFNKNLDQFKDASDVPSEAYSGLNFSTGSWSLPSATKLQAVRPDGEAALTVDDLMTMPINRDDYVVMKDVRFFLGKEHGKSHFEDTLHWDWNDPIDTPHSNVLSSTTLNNKNFRWHMTLIGTNGGNTADVVLNHHIRWTTKMESG